MILSADRRRLKLWAEPGILLIIAVTEGGISMANLIFFGMCFCTITAAVVSIILDRVFRHE